MHCRVTSFLLLVAAAALPLSAQSPAWVELAPGGVAIARTIVTTADCPAITFGDQRVNMTLRAAPTPAYNVRVCEAVIPAGTHQASINGAALPVASLNASPQRVVIVGDTGCRLKCPSGGSSSVQDCNDPTKWPFATVAKSIADWKPDLIIHVGDYYYREYTTCPNGQNVYDWTNWNADFFTPATPMFGAAPIVFLRGNHESCARAAEGWFRFLDPRTFSYTAASCPDRTDPYWATAGDMQFAVIDTNAVADEGVKKKQAAHYAKQFEQLAKSQGKQEYVWLFAHHPMWAVVGGDDDDDDGDKSGFSPVTATMQAAWDQAKHTPSAQLVLTGHVHLFEALDFKDGKPPQLVLGNGGTQLDKNVPSSPEGTKIDTRKVSDFVTQDTFGYAAATRNADGHWTFAIVNASGQPMYTCELRGGKTNCVAAK